MTLKFIRLFILLTIPFVLRGQTVNKNVQKAADGTNAITESLAIGAGKTLSGAGSFDFSSGSLSVPATLTRGAFTITWPGTTSTLATLAGSESLANKKLGSLTSNGLVTTSGGDGTLSVTVPGTGVIAALGNATNASGGLVTFSGTLGSPSATAISVPTLTSVSSITGGAGNMTITAGTGNSRTLTLQSTTSSGVATTFLTGNADQSTTLAGNLTFGSRTLGAWDTTFSAVEGGDNGSTGQGVFYVQRNGDYTTGIATNTYYNGGWKRPNAAVSGRAELYQNTWNFYTGATGSAAGAITWVQRLALSGTAADFTGITTSGTSTTAASILGKSMGLTENLYVGGSINGSSLTAPASTTLSLNGGSTSGDISLNTNSGSQVTVNTSATANDFVINSGASVASSALVKTGGRFLRWQAGTGRTNMVFTSGGPFAFDTASTLNGSQTEVGRWSANGNWLVGTTADPSGSGAISVGSTTEATTGGAGSLTTAGGIYAAKKIIGNSDLIVAKTLVTTPTALTYASPTSVDVTLGNVFTATTVNATGSVTFNATAGGTAGQRIVFIITNDATSAKTITFGTNFSANGTLTPSGVNKVATIEFISNGTTLYELCRTVLP